MLTSSASWQGLTPISHRTSRTFARLESFLDLKTREKYTLCSRTGVNLSSLQARFGSAIALLRWGYLDYAFSQPRVFDYVFSRPRMDARRFQNDFEERRSPMLNRVADAVDEGMKAGRLRKDGRCMRLRCGPGDPNNR